MKTPGQRGSFGEWLRAERTRRYKTQKDALADMRRLAGLSIAESEFAQWESGSRVPREGNPKVAALYEFFGSRPEDDPGDVPATGTLEAILAEQVELNRRMLRRLELLESLVARLLPVDATAEALAFAADVVPTTSPAPTPDPAPRGAG